MTPNKEILDDIENWSEARLKQWFVDSMTRYEMLNMTEQAAMSATMITLMAMCSTILALTRITPEEAGSMLVGSIQIIRNHNDKASRKREEECAPPKA